MSNKAAPAGRTARRQSLPAPFTDSYTTREAEISVTVGKPHGARYEEVLVSIDCGGRVSLDLGELDVVITMLEDARINLKRRGKARR